MPISPDKLEARRRVLIDAAHALIRENGDAGFSMVELALRAGVSQATPYNLLGSKAELLHLVVQDEFEGYIPKLKALMAESPLDHLLQSVDLIANHYRDDQNFYRGLFYSRIGSEAESALRSYLSQSGRELWQPMVRRAVTAGEFRPTLDVELFTDYLLRAIRSTTEAWIVECWTADRFALEMGYVARLLAAGVATAKIQQSLWSDLEKLEAGIRNGVDSNARPREAAINGCD